MEETEAPRTTIPDPAAPSAYICCWRHAPWVPLQASSSQIATPHAVKIGPCTNFTKRPHTCTIPLPSHKIKHLSFLHLNCLLS
ncbi:hypothetical protein AMELA_G00048670, partial [Ameiurus melas]